MIRPQRLWAVAWRDLRLVHSGRSWWKLPALALSLLLPLGLFPSELPELEELPAVASGEIPAALEGKITYRPQASLHISGEDPVEVRSGSMSPSMRRVLDTLPGPRVRLEVQTEELKLPGRGLLIALLAISLLTGPLSESMAGERRRGTLETLLTAGISRGELLGGKWVAWSLASGGVTLLVALSGLLRGELTPGPWPLGLPMVAAVAVALGLWLGRNAPDEVAGAARTMRVLPIAALALGGVAWSLIQLSPLIAALVPLGGGLMVASGLLTGPLTLLLSLLGTLLASAALLWHTGRGLDNPSRPTARLAGLTTLLTGALLWWLPVAGPVIWALGGNVDLTARLPRDASLATAGALLALYSLVQVLKHPQKLIPSRWRPSLLAGLPVGLVLGLAGRLPSFMPTPSSPALQLLQPRLQEGLQPGTLGVLTAALVALGHEAFFRHLLPRRLGPWLALLAWVLLVAPQDPLHGLVSGLALGLIAHRHGWLAAFSAHLVWSLLPVAVAPASPSFAVAAGLGAVVLAAWLPGEGSEPPRP